MCQNCQAGTGPEQQIDFLTRYLREQERKLDSGRPEPGLEAEIEKTRELIESLRKNHPGVRS